MRRFNYNLSHIFFSVFLTSSAWAVPVDYCLQPLNTKDCKVDPTPVFSYYGPGSRCEIGFWRGCPTLNKFDNEFDCSHMCIGLIRSGLDDNLITELNSTEVVSDDCAEPINTNPCTNIEEAVYTYDSQTCIKTTWRGCTTGNKFKDEKSCIDTCAVKDVIQWKEELEAIPEADILNLFDLVDFLDVEKTTEEPPTTTTIDPATTESTTTESTTTESTTTESTTTESTTTESTTTESTTTESTTTESTTTESTTTESTTPISTTTERTTPISTTTPSTTPISTTTPSTTIDYEETPVVNA